jgi:DNA-binding MarR family transcriptional regulator
VSKNDVIDRIGRLVMRFQDASQQFDEKVGELYDLNAAERHCLSFLVGSGPQTASAIAREIRLTPAAVTALVDRLERRGYVRRSSDPGDRRKVLVSAAERTTLLAEAVYARSAEAGAEMLARHSEAELLGFARLLEEVVTVQERLTEELVAGEAEGTGRTERVPRLPARERSR